ncbi:hypothetical protein [Streptomyces sp. NPDC047973]|uniref:hypothetical protein n=1 Tax=Streptomyces sp. NPDC047973 TaxID=3155383 RepID=UPI00341B343A
MDRASPDVGCTALPSERRKADEGQNEAEEMRTVRIPCRTVFSTTTMRLASQDLLACLFRRAIITPAEERAFGELNWFAAELEQTDPTACARYEGYLRPGLLDGWLY